MSIYLSSGAFASRSLSEIITTAQDTGLRQLEFTANVTPATIEDVKATLTTADSSFNFLFHNYFPPPLEPFVLNLAAADEWIHTQSVALCKQAIKLSAEFNAPFYSVHAGFAFHLTPTMLGDPVTQATVPDALYTPRPQAYQKFVATVHQLADFAAQHKIKLLIENNVVSPLYLSNGENRGLLLADSAEMLRFMHDMRGTSVQLLLDVAHLNVSATALGFDRVAALQAVAPHLGALHLSDNDGIVDSNQPISADSWFMPQLAQFRHLPWVIEVYHLTATQINAQIALLETIS